MVAGLGCEEVATAGRHGIEALVMSPYAAVPSGHAAFALLVAGTGYALAGTRRGRTIALLYPLIVLTEIVATGNHLWLDAVFGACAAGAGTAVALARHRLPRASVAVQADG